MHRVKEDLRRYAFAALAVVAALLLRRLLNPLLGEQNPYHTIWFAIVLSAWYCGFGPSIVAVLIAAFGMWYWFLPPYHSLALKSQTEIFGMLAFLAFSAVMVGLGQSTRRIIQEHEQAEEELRKARAELESRIARRTEQLQQRISEVVEKAALLDLANDAVFVKTANGTISYWNQGAERLYGWAKREAVGRSPHDLLRTEFPVPLTEIQERDRWEGELRQKKRDGTQITVASRWTTMRDAKGKAIGWLEINTDISSRKRAEDAARRLSGRILTLQDDERRRIARGLHDSLGQFLAALKMNLNLLPNADGNAANLVSECSGIVDQCLVETRTISHLLHPPLLDEIGVGSALRWYVDGFAQRSGVKVTLNLAPEVGRLHKDVEIALFRAVQEALTNVHRHAGASAVDIRVDWENQKVRLEIRDNGRGIPKGSLSRLTDGDPATGVGIAGIRERVRELHGSLEIQSDETGTAVTVTIPVPQTSGDSSHDYERSRNISAA